MEDLSPGAIFIRMGEAHRHKDLLAASVSVLSGVSVNKLNPESNIQYSESAQHYVPVD